MLLEKLPPKWNPLARQPEDFEEAPNAPENEDPTEPERTIPFNPRITEKGDLKDAIRIFTSGKSCKTTQEQPTEWVGSENGHDEILPESKDVYTDGGCMHNGDKNAKAGVGVWFSQNDDRNEAIKLPAALRRRRSANDCHQTAICGKGQDIKTSHLKSDTSCG